jgi:hypothetical protein
MKPQSLVSPVFACSVAHTIAFAAKTGDEFEALRDDDGSISAEERAGEHFVYTGVLITNTPVFADYLLVFADYSLVFADYSLVCADFVLLFSKHSSKH